MRSSLFVRLKNSVISILFTQSYVSSAITGSVIILVLLVVLQENPPGPIESVILIAWTVLCINSLRVFSQMVGRSIEEKRVLQRHEKMEFLNELGYMVVEVFPILIIFLLSWAGLFDIAAAYKLTIIVIISLLFFYGFTIIRLRTNNMLVCTLGGIGFVLVALTLVLMRMLIK